MATKAPSSDLTDRFIKGLLDYDLTYDEILNGGWKYCGGNKGRHLNYFKLSCKDDDLPEKNDRCVCGHKIVENCYITNGDDILVLGNCCIKKFVPNSSRTCDKCNKPHKNRKVNQCNNCRTDLSCIVCKNYAIYQNQKCKYCQYKRA